MLTVTVACNDDGIRKFSFNHIATAAGATEAEHLGYMSRLGLWGRGTAFRDMQEFVSIIHQGGVAAMELVAMELKQARFWSACWFLACVLAWYGLKLPKS